MNQDDIDKIKALLDDESGKWSLDIGDWIGYVEELISEVERLRMSKYRRAAKVDANQAGIVKALDEIPGVTVKTGHDDILVGYKGHTYWYEIKNPNTVGADGQVMECRKKPSQRRLEDDWEGHYRIVWRIEQILKDMGVTT